MRGVWLNAPRGAATKKNEGRWHCVSDATANTANVENTEADKDTVMDETPTTVADNTPTREGKGKPAAPWDGETFDADRAAVLVANLRAENKDLREKAKKAESDRITELETALAERDAQLASARNERTKETLLVERGLPLNLIGALAGEDERAWEEMADMLKALKVEGVSVGSEKVVPDPVQSAVGATAGGDAARLALANQLFSGS